MADNRKITTIEEYIKYLSPEHKKIIEKMRRMVIGAIPDARERILWSSPWYYVNDKPIVWFMDNVKHINFGFAYGSRLSSTLLEGTGKNMRHVKIYSFDDLGEKEKELITLLHDAVERQVSA